MEGVVGVFQSRVEAEHAVRDLRENAFGERQIIFITPECNPQELANVPTTAAEEPGIGKAISSYLGAAIGAGAGFGLGTAAASLVIPGVGPIFAVGLGAAALLGLGGAAVGASVGEETETRLDEGIPRDEINDLREFLRRGSTLVIVNVNTPERVDQAQQVIRDHGGLRFDQVRHHLRHDAA
ncbi:MAG: hypothetical protein ACR2IF_19325 [Terriglobales bacterium]